MIRPEVNAEWPLSQSDECFGRVVDRAGVRHNQKPQDPSRFSDRLLGLVNNLGAPADLRV